MRLVGMFALVAAGCDGAIRGPADSDADVDADAGGDADTDADADVPADADQRVDADLAPGACPAEMVEVPETGFCIDRYEASVDEAGVAHSVRGVLPASEVNWRTADAACRAAGKVLCPRDVWYAACSAGGTRERPYGNAYDPTACNGGDDDLGLQPTGSMPGCEGSLDGLFDMTGNVWEWIAECTADSMPQCAARGCEWDCQASMMTCDSEVTLSWVSPLQGSGFRCCLAIAEG